MYQAFLTIWRTPALRIATLTMFAAGFGSAATYPYLSLVALDQLGLSEQHFGLILLAAAVLATLNAVIISHFSDQARDRKGAVLRVLAMGALGYALFALWPSVPSFLALLLFFGPIVQTTTPQLFALIRAHTAEMSSQESASINAMVRTTYSGSWIITPGLVGLYIAWTGRASDAFGVAAVALTLCFVLYLTLGARGGRAEPPEQSAIAGLIEAFRLVLSRRIIGRVGALAMIGIAQSVNASLLPILITTEAGGTTGDVGVIAGLTAALEIPLMLAAGWVVLRWSVTRLIASGGVLFAVYMFALSGAAAMPVIYGLTVILAAGQAVMFSQHLSFMQDLMPERPGLGTSLLSIEMLLVRGLGAAVVAGLGLVYGLSGAFIVTALVGAAGVVTLLLIGRRAY